MKEMGRPLLPHRTAENGTAPWYRRWGGGRLAGRGRAGGLPRVIQPAYWRRQYGIKLSRSRAPLQPNRGGCYLRRPNSLLTRIFFRATPVFELLVTRRAFVCGSSPFFRNKNYGWKWTKRTFVEQSRGGQSGTIIMLKTLKILGGGRDTCVNTATLIYCLPPPGAQ